LAVVEHDEVIARAIHLGERNLHNRTVHPRPELPGSQEGCAKA
jgi:hypothetical protein